VAGRRADLSCFPSLLHNLSFVVFSFAIVSSFFSSSVEQSRRDALASAVPSRPAADCHTAALSQMFFPVIVFCDGLANRRVHVRLLKPQCPINDFSSQDDEPASHQHEKKNALASSHSVGSAIKRPARVGKTVKKQTNRKKKGPEVTGSFKKSPFDPTSTWFPTCGTPRSKCLFRASACTQIRAGISSNSTQGKSRRNATPDPSDP